MRCAPSPVAQVRRLGLSPATEEELRRQRPDANGLLVIDQVLPDGPAQHKLEVRGEGCEVRGAGCGSWRRWIKERISRIILRDPDPPRDHPAHPAHSFHSPNERAPNTHSRTHGIIAHCRSVTSCCRSMGSRPTASSRSSTPSTPPQSSPSLPPPLAVAPDLVGLPSSTRTRLSRRRRPLRVMARAQFASSSNEAVSAWR